MSRLLVTGATGFVGKHLVHRLCDDGSEVGAIVRANSDISRLDPRVRCMIVDGTTESIVDAVQKFRPDVAVHAATHFVAQHTSADVTPMLIANVLFGCQLLQALQSSSCSRLVNFGTTWQNYGSESYKPSSLYAATKQAFECLAAYYADVCGLRMVTLKVTDTYGPEDSRRKLLSSLKESAINGTELAMSLGEQIVNFVHVFDVVEAVRVAIRRTSMLDPGLEDFTVASDDQLTLRDFVACVSQAFGLPLRVKWGARPYREREVMVPTLGKRLPEWSPSIGLMQGLSEMPRV